jgi:hypothetical protein
MISIGPSRQALSIAAIRCSAISCAIAAPEIQRYAPRGRKLRFVFFSHANELTNSHPTSLPHFPFARLPIFDIRPQIFVNNEVMRLLHVVVRSATEVVLLEK